MNKTQKQNLVRLENRLCNMGINLADIRHLLRIERALHRWHELECGTDRGAIERNERTNKPYWRHAGIGWNGLPQVRLTPMRDMEKSNMKALAGLMKSYPKLLPYVQTDPHGCSLYIIDRADLPPGFNINSCYTRGVAVCI